MADLFDTAPGSVPDTAPRPLADRLRPRKLSEVIGQDQVLGPEAPLGVMLSSGSLGSLVFWGPPGVGKTTIARLLADETDLHFVQISAIFTGVPELRKVFEAAKHRRANGQGTLLFVDEIHRFNKAQQDGFLPHMEDGTILLVGATTENPSFELNAALLSRAQVLVLNRLDAVALEHLLQRAEKEHGAALPLTGEAREALIEMADGDGRAILNLVEQVPYDISTSGNSITVTLGAKSTINDVANIPVVSGTSVNPSVGSGINNIDFRRGENGEGRIIVDLADPSIGIDIGEKGGKVVVDFLNI